MTLLLIMAVMGIVAATAVTSFKFDIRRDREEEMIHRGVQYSRAIRAYYRKFGRYPATIENLENTNQQRFLRKRYKDPITGREFRLLHFGEAKLSLNGMGSGVIPGASTLGSNGKLTPNDTSNSVFGNSTLGQTSQTTQKATAGTSQTGDAGSNSDSAGQSGTDSNDTSDQGSAEQSAQTFGGLPIVGVASTSKEATIREFDRKRKYNEWQFVFDPSLDRGFLITEPYQPQLQMFGMNPQNVNGTGGQNPTPGLGTAAPGTGMNPGASGNAPGNTNEPADTPVQQ